MFDFYFAGAQCNEADVEIVQLHENRLFSYVENKKQIKDYIQHKKEGWKGKLLIDSGAFTAHRKDISINLDDYCNWINENSEYIFKAIVLDHIPGKFGVPRTIEDVLYAQQKSYDNYCYMLTKVKDKTKILPVFHQGESFEYLDKYLNTKIDNENLDYMCISGMKDLTKKQRQNWYTQVYDHIKKSNNPNIKTHILGSATISDAQNFPCTSMDATSWIMSGANGSILTDYGTVYVSDSGKHLPNHINNMPNEAQLTIQNYLESCNLTLNEVQTDYKQRMIANVYYLHNKSNTTVFTQTTIKKRRLF